MKSVGVVSLYRRLAEACRGSRPQPVSFIQPATIRQSSPFGDIYTPGRHVIEVTLPSGLYQALPTCQGRQGLYILFYLRFGGDVDFHLITDIRHVFVEAEI